MTKSLHVKGYIVTVDIKKAFDALSYSFLFVCLKKYGYGNDFIKWVEILLNAKSLALLMEVVRQNILNFKKVLDKAIQFPHTYLFYVLKFYSF